jgi:hypothetical protein
VNITRVPTARRDRADDGARGGGLEPVSRREKARFFKGATATDGHRPPQIVSTGHKFPDLTRLRPVSGRVRACRRGQFFWPRPPAVYEHVCRIKQSVPLTVHSGWPSWWQSFATHVMSGAHLLLSSLPGCPQPTQMPPSSPL